MGNKGNPRRQLRNKLIAGGIGALLLAGCIYSVFTVYEHIEKQEGLINEYQETLVEQGSLIDQHKETLSIQRGEISDLTNKVNTLNKQVDALNTELDKKDKAHKKAEETYKGKIEDLKQDLATKKANEARELALASRPAPVTHVAHVSTGKPSQRTTASQPKKIVLASRGKSPSGKTLTVSATAYTAFCNGCSGITATGINLRANPGLKVIAVDPRVIPLGSKVYVEGYGYAVAGDTGGAIKGNKIDLFMPDKQAAFKWGRKTIQIKIIQ